jgi:hypothetical protein
MVTITSFAGGAQSDKVIKTLGIFPKSEIVSVSGIALAGPLPPALQLTLPTAPASLAGAKSHGRACPGHPRLASQRKSWMPGTRPGMTNFISLPSASRECSSPA